MESRVNQTIVTGGLLMLLVYVVYRAYTSFNQAIAYRRKAREDKEFLSLVEKKKKEIEDAQKAYDDASRGHRDPKQSESGRLH